MPAPISTLIPRKQNLHRSARVYTPWVLRAYDIVVLWFSNNWAWRCPTPTVLLPFFKKHVADQTHLDIGVGTGYFPAHAVDQLCKVKQVYLADLNTTALRMASERLEGAGYQGNLQAIVHDVFEPLPLSINRPVDSISLFYLFHCLPGAFPEKAERVLPRLAQALTSGGTLYGATILGKGVKHNWVGNLLMGRYNGKGIFCNYEDSEEGLVQALKMYFIDVNVEVVGVVALFVAKQPVRKLALRLPAPHLTITY